MRLSMTAALVAAACLMLDGCASAPLSLAPPQVYVSALRVLPQEGERRSLGVTLLLRNLNEYPVNLRSIDFTVRIGTEGFFDGTISAPTTVPALDDTYVQTTVSAEFLSSVSRLVSFLQGPESALPYEVSGTMWLDTRPPRDIRFTNTGQTPLSMSATP